MWGALPAPRPYCPDRKTGSSRRRRAGPLPQGVGERLTNREARHATRRPSARDGNGEAASLKHFEGMSAGRRPSDAVGGVSLAPDGSASGLALIFASASGPKSATPSSVDRLQVFANSSALSRKSEIGGRLAQLAKAKSFSNVRSCPNSAHSSSASYQIPLIRTRGSIGAVRWT